MRFAPLVMLLPILGLLCGCGGGGGSSTASTAATAAVVPTPTAPVVTPPATTPPATTDPTTTPAPTTPVSTLGSPCPLTLNGVRYVLSSLAAPNYACSSENGGVAQRFEVRSGDRGYSGDAAANNERSELVTDDPTRSQSAFLYRSNADAWLSFSFMVEAGDAITSSFAVVGQYHSEPDPADAAQSPPIAFNLYQLGSTLTYSLITHSDSAATTTVNPAGVTRWQGALTRGQWANLVLRSRADPFGSGQVQLWVNGVEQINLSNIAIGYNNAVDGAYFQYGIYRGASTNTLAVRYANLEQTTHSLAARVTAPLAIP